MRRDAENERNRSSSPVAEADDILTWAYRQPYFCRERLGGGAGAQHDKSMIIRWRSGVVIAAAAAVVGRHDARRKRPACNGLRRRSRGLVGYFGSLYSCVCKMAACRRREAAQLGECHTRRAHVLGVWRRGLAIAHCRKASRSSISTSPVHRPPSSIGLSASWHSRRQRGQCLRSFDKKCLVDDGGARGRLAICAGALSSMTAWAAMPDVSLAQMLG